MNKKRVGMIAVIVLLLVIAVGVGVSLARYSSTSTGTADAQVATWSVKVNDTDIVQTATFTLDEDDIQWSDSEYIADGYIAPSRTGTFSLVLDTTGSKVAVQYSIAVDDSALDDYAQINITRVNNQAFNGSSYTGMIPLANVDTPLTIPVQIEWTNDEANNASDTTIGSTVTEFSIPITVTAEQYLGN